MLCDVVRPSRRECGNSLGIDGQIRGDGAEEEHRHSRREVGNRLGEPDDEAKPFRHDPSHRGGSSRKDVLGAEDRVDVLSPWRFHGRAEGAVDALANALAWTGAPLLKRKPLRNVKVYVRPSLEMRGKPAATSGDSRNPALPGLSG